MPVVTFLGELRRAAGRPTVAIEARTVAHLLVGMGRAIGPAFADLLLRDGGLQPDVEVLVNGRNIQFLNMLETPLRSSDQITMFLGGVRGFPGG